MGLFTPIIINKLELKNRIMMSPAFSNSAAPGGFVTDWTLRHYQKRAAAGVGLVMVEHTSVNGYYIHGGNRLQVSTDKHIPGLASLARTIQHAGAKAGLQIAHSIHGVGLKPDDLPKRVILEMIQEFIQGARRAFEAGFDVVELHFAHTYTMADLLSRRTNRRLDEYGGDIYGRMRAHKEVILGIRELLGSDVPLFACFSADEFIIGGNTLKQTRIVAQELEKCGIDCLDVTAGVRFDDGGLKGYSDLRGKPTVEYPDGPNVYLAEDIKKYVSVPVITRGKLGNPDFAASVVEQGRADMIAMIRPMLADDKWVKKVKAGRPELIKTCVACNNCLYKRRHPDDPIKCMERECAKCLTCLRSCPYHLPFINDQGILEFGNDWCDECGMCSGLCPAQVVRFQTNPQYDWVLDQVAPAVRKLKSKELRAVIINCASGPFRCDDKFMAEGLAHNVALIRVPCPGKIETVQMLRILELGVDGILMARCTIAENPECKYRHHQPWASRRVRRANEILNEAQLNHKSVIEIELTGLQALDLSGLTREFVHRLQVNKGEGGTYDYR
ncbi:MAG: hydrogenase iron-sulfur subunit [Bacillota bacterium]